jgi:hypothetical protein
MYYEVLVVPEHVDVMLPEDGQLTETCKSNKYLQTESHWTALTAILKFSTKFVRRGKGTRNSI